MRRKTVIRVKKIFLIFAVFLIALVPTTGEATHWSMTRCITRESIWYIDESSVAYDSNANGELIFHAFFKEEYLPPSPGFFGGGLRNSPAYSINLAFFKKSGSLKYVSIDSAVYYAYDGSVINGKSYSRSYHDFHPITPDTVGEALFDAAYRCL